MQKIFTAIYPSGILPALVQQISQAGELGIFENQICLRCRQDDFPRSLLSDSPEVLQFLPMCTGQISFQALCTRIVESNLLGTVVRHMYRRYAFINYI